MYPTEYRMTKGIILISWSPCRMTTESWVIRPRSSSGSRFSVSCTTISIAKGVGSAKDALWDFAHNLLTPLLVLTPWRFSPSSYIDSDNRVEAISWEVHPFPHPWPPVGRRFDAYGMLKDESGESRLDSYDDVITDSLIESMPYQAGQLADAVGFKYRARLAPIVGTKRCDPDLK